MLAMARHHDAPPARRNQHGTILAREFFDLQLTFAERVSALSGMPLERALFDYTNLYVRFGLGRAFDPEHDGWRAYIDGLRTAADGREWTYRFYLRDAEVNTGPATVATFGCFSYAIQEDNVLRLHFRNTEPTGLSPLGASCVERRRAELAALFAQLRSERLGDLTVVGISWLYNLHAYRRLFPPAYTASPRVLQGPFRSMPLWGQFVDYRGEVKAEMRISFLKALAELESLGGIGDCFPFQALRVEEEVETFYRFYEGQLIGVESDSTPAQNSTSARNSTPAQNSTSAQNSTPARNSTPAQNSTSAQSSHQRKDSTPAGNRRG
jgi:hypothetical protein